MNAKTWRQQHPLNPDLIWKDGQDRQIRDALKVAKILGIEVSFVGHHLSKSVPLPVVEYKLPTSAGVVRVLVRDNFYSVQVSILDTIPGLGLSLPEKYCCYLYGAVYFEGINKLVPAAACEPCKTGGTMFGASVGVWGELPTWLADAPQERRDAVILLVDLLGWISLNNF